MFIMMGVFFGTPYDKKQYNVADFYFKKYPVKISLLRKYSFGLWN